MKNKIVYRSDHFYCATIKEHVLGRAKITVSAIASSARHLNEDLDADTIVAICRGELKVFVARVRVQFDGNILENQWLHDCIYEKYEDFLKSGYVMDMVHDAVDASRKLLKLRAVAKLTA